jgi:broad specificity phosphatase PhoE
MPEPDEKLKERKERQAQQAGKKAWDEHQAEADASRAKAARLRAARLARPADVAKKKKVRSKKKR